MIPEADWIDSDNRKQLYIALTSGKVHVHLSNQNTCREDL